ncbi:MAG: ankyrin repeat domain-containing protein, partial [Pirellulaceae bacterium]
DRSATVLLRKLDFDDIEGVRYLLDRGVDVNHAGYWGKTPLHQVIMRGRDLPTIQLLVDRGADVNATRKSDGATPYLLACLYGRDDVAQRLVDNGASARLTPVESLMAVCGLGLRDEAMALVQENPQLPDELTEDQHRVITLAGRKGNQQAIDTMLDVGFDIAARDEQGFTALHWAAWYGHLPCVQRLLERGAPLDIKNNYGGTVIDSTVWGYANSDGDDRHCREILEQLVAAGANVHDVSPFPSGHGESDDVLRGHGRHQPMPLNRS